MQNQLTLYSLYENCRSDSSTIIYYDGLKKHSLKFTELYASVDFISQLLNNLSLSEINICCLIKQNLALPAIILGILKVSSTFAFLDINKPLERLQEFQKYLDVETLIIEDSFLEDLNSKLCSCWKKLSQFHKYSDFIIFKSFKCKNKDCPNTKEYVKWAKQSAIAYNIQTSGSTGEPKVVQVPHECITSNIIDLRSRFCVTRNDVILQSTQITFDPSIIEIFLSLSSGASLVIVADHIRTVPQKLIEVIVNEKITIFQGTPSLIYNFGEEILKNVLLHEKSTLRILAFGGEICPSINKLQTWKSDGNKTELYNLYGLTELSCWASCFKIDFNNRNFVSSIPIDEPLLDTKLEIRNEDGEIADKGELYIGGFGKRFCIINDEKCLDDLKYFMRPTGDLVTKASDGFIYFDGRIDSIIKYMGHKISLKLVNDKMEKFCEVANHFLHYDSQSSRLYLFIVWTSESSYQREIEQKLLTSLKNEVSNLPAIIIVPIAFIPLTNHGKADVRKLMNLASEIQKKRNNSRSISEKDIDEIISSLWKNYTNQQAILENDSFIEKGGDSIAAIQIAVEIEWKLQLQLPLLIEKILNKQFKQIKDYIKSSFKSSLKMHEGIHENDPQPMKIHEFSSIESNNQPLKKRRCHDISHCFKVNFKQGSKEYCKHTRGSNNCFNRIYSSYENLELHLSFTWDLKKCIDATPCILYLPHLSELLIFIGSHYGIFSCIDVNKKAENWQILVPDRIESSACVSACGCYVLFGCYDHHLYCIDIANGAIHWKYETGAEVKSSPSVSFCNKVFVGSHDKHVYSIDVQSGLFLWRKQVGCGSIFSSPAIIEEIDAICVGTLDGMLALLKMTSGDVIWKYNAGKPLFSSPLVIANFILIGSTDKRLLCLDFNGKENFVYTTEGPIFSSAVSHKDCDDHVVFGCHDCYVYCITLNGNLKWKAQCDSTVYATPVIFKYNCIYYVCVASTQGIIYFFDLTNGKIIFSWKCLGEVFSSPIILNDTLVIGCRDNNVYCFILKNCIDNI